LSPEEAKAALSHVTIGLDLTNRTLQQKAKVIAGPWEVGKVFPEATVIGPWLLYDSEKELSFSYRVNNEIRQQSSSASMRLNPIELLVYASQYFPICKGDLLFTGTPAGVDAIMTGDKGKLQLQNYEYEVQW
jgi:2-keto-4-pentenoate hydratase/2-oxohepta-3-ene-1,7-dioic acid hydratase in catechol pathway